MLLFFPLATKADISVDRLRHELTFVQRSSSELSAYADVQEVKQVSLCRISAYSLLQCVLLLSTNINQFTGVGK